MVSTELGPDSKYKKKKRVGNEGLSLTSWKETGEEKKTEGDPFKGKKTKHSVSRAEQGREMGPVTFLYCCNADK